MIKDTSEGQPLIDPDVVVETIRVKGSTDHPVSDKILELAGKLLVGSESRQDLYLELLRLSNEVLALEGDAKYYEELSKM